MAATLEKWEEAWSRLIEARKKLLTFEPDHALVLRGTQTVISAAHLLVKNLNTFLL